ncbi:hypothetical protein EXE25_18790 [Acinetobacter bouvetii]|uniref:Uncharacterized protein n=1 Tax=Acinetobacter bouvetii TaxID=202951 RepID=A0A4V2DNN6_9GAMM|nr:hypothetical protein [Acinetobacter bouvetii]RZG63709.1 hypothetical protein EXE25_18790 [Acinetobacter bouvetii]
MDNFEDRLYEPLEYLEKFSDNVINNQFNDLGLTYLITFRELVLGFARCGAYKSVEDFDKSMEIYEQLQKLFD